MMRQARCMALGVVVMAAGMYPLAIASAQAGDSSSPIDPDAISALTAMGTYLRTLNAFQVKATVTTEEVLLDGQKVQLSSVAELVAERPAKLRLDVTSDRQHRLFLYDGSTFTLFAPRLNYYATVPAPPTTAALADSLEEKYGIELPFIDLFKWGTPASGLADITAAEDLGPSVVDGTTCEHFAFRQSGLDWQVWIQNGDFPLPRKLVLTTLTDEARPQHTSTYAWNLAPSVNASAFVFTPPSDARKIPLASVSARYSALNGAGGKP